MMVSLLMPVLLAPATVALPARSIEPDPPVQVWLSSRAEFNRGDRARVFVRTEQDGYLVVLHSDADGRLRVLFPLDPGQDEFVRGGQNIEIRGRADRDAFLVDERDGTGIVLAAWSPDPFRFDGIVQADHWDYRLMANGTGGDAEAALLDVADHVSNGQRYYYDVAEYIVGRPAVRSNSAVYLSVGYDRSYCYSCWGFGYSTWSPGFNLSISIGSPWRYRSIWHDPWYRYRSPYFYSGWYDPFWTPIYRPVYVWNPYPNYYRGPRTRGYGFGDHYRYADACWGDPYCGRWNTPRGRSGRATGVGFSQSGRYTAFGLSEPIRESPGLGMSRFVRQNERASEPRRVADGLTSPDRMRGVLPSDGRVNDGGIARSTGSRSRIAQPRAESETGRFDTRPGNGVSRAVRADGNASNGAAREQASTDPVRGNARLREQVRQPGAEQAQRADNSSNGIRASDGRTASPRTGGQATPDRSWILSPPQRSTDGNVRSNGTGSNADRTAVRASEARSTDESNARQRIRSSAGDPESSSAVPSRAQPERSSPARSSSESDSRARIRSSTGNSGTSASPPSRQVVPRSSGQVVPRSSGQDVPRSSGTSAVPRSQSGIRSSAPARTSEPPRSSGAIRSNVQRSGNASRVSEPPRSSSVQRGGNAVRESAARSSSGSASRTSGSASRSGSSSARASTGGSSKGVASAARRKN